MRTLINENSIGIKSYTDYVNQLVANCNQVLTVFPKYNFFKIEVDKQTAFALVENPEQFFDNLLIKHNPVKAINTPDITIIAEMLGVTKERAAFQAEVIALRPGGRLNDMAPVRLHETQKHLVIFDNGVFQLNEQTLFNELEKYRFYAENETELAILNYWQSFSDVMNTHYSKKYCSASEIDKLSRIVGLEVFENQFVINKDRIEAEIKQLRKQQ